MIDTRLGTARLLEFLPGVDLPQASLLSLTGDEDSADAGWFASGLEQRIAVAWKKPLQDITCGEVRMLAGQRMAVAWLAKAIALFVARYPDAECDLYPGDLTENALSAWRELHAHAPAETRTMLAADFAFLVEEAVQSELSRDALDALAVARRELSITA